MNKPPSPLPFDPVHYIVTTAGMLAIIVIVAYGPRILDIFERWMLTPGAPSPAPRRHRRLRDYLVSYEFWVGGVVFFVLSLFVHCEWFRR